MTQIFITHNHLYDLLIIMASISQWVFAQLAAQNIDSLEKLHKVEKFYLSSFLFFVLICQWPKVI